MPTLQSVLADLANQTGGTTSTTYQAINNAINASPALATALTNDIANGEITAINYGSGTGGDFDPTTKAINLSASFLDPLVNDTNTAQSTLGIIFTLGHEDEHAEDNATLNATNTGEYAEWASDLPPAGSSSATFLAAAVGYQNIGLTDEAKANIQGMNFVYNAVANATAGSPLAGLSQQGVISDTPQNYTLYTSVNNSWVLDPGIASNSDGTVAATPESVAAAAQIMSTVTPSTAQSGSTTDYGIFYASPGIMALCQQNGGTLSFSFSSLGLTDPLINMATGQPGSSPLTSNQVGAAIGQYTFPNKCVFTNTDDGSTETFSPNTSNNSTLYNFNSLPSPSGVVTNDTSDIDSSGTAIYTQDEDIASNGTIAATISGIGDVAAFSNTSVLLTVGASAVIEGIANAITASSANTSIQGDNNTVTATSGTINDSSGDTGNVFDGNGTTINAGSGFAGTVEGTSNSIYLTASSSSSLAVYGASETVYSTGNLLNVDGTNTSATVAGTNTVDLNAANQSLTLSTTGDTVDSVANDTGEIISGSGFTLDGAAGQFTGTITGSGNTFDLDTSSSSSLSLTGTGNVANSVGNTIALQGASSSATVSGADTVDLDAASQSLTLSTTGDTVDGLAKDTGETISGSDFTLDGAAGQFTGTVTGGGNTFDLDAGSSSALTLGGTNNSFDTANTTSAALTLEGNTQLNVSGSSNTITLAAGDSMGAYGGGNTINTAADEQVVIGNTGNSFDAIDGSNDAQGSKVSDGSTSGIVLEANTQANVSGSNDFVGLASGDSMGVYGGGNTIDTAADEQVVIGSTGGSFDTVDGSNDGQGSKVSDGSTSGIVLDANAQANVTGSDDFVGLASGDSMGVYGGGNTIDAAADELVVIGSTGGVADIVNAASDVGGATTANGQGTGIYLDASAQATVEGAGDTVDLASSDTLTMTASGDTVDVAAGGLGDAITGTSDTIDAGSDFYSSVSGSGNTVSLVANSGSLAAIYGTSETVDTTGNTVNIASGAGVTVNGVTTVGLCGTGIIADLTSAGATIDTIAGATGELVTGTDITVNGASNFTGFMDGSDNTYNLTSNSGSSVALFGTGDKVNSTDNNIDLSASGITETVAGSGNTVDLQSTSENLTLSSAGDTVDTASNSTGDVITATGDTIDGGSDLTGFVFGSSDTIDLTTNSGSSVALFGTGDKVNSTDNNIDLSASGITETVAGSGNTVDLQSTSENLTLSSAGDTVDTASNSTGDVITATGDTIDGGSDLTGFIFGSSDTVDLTSNTNSSVALFGTGDTVSSSYNNVFLSTAGISDTVSGTYNTVTLQSSDQTIAINGDTVDADSGDKGDVIDGAYDTLHEEGTGSFTVDGSLDVITGSDDQTSINGQSDTIDESHATIDVAGDDGVTIDGSDDKIVGNNGDHFTVTGTDDDVDASDSSITFDGTNTGDYVGGSGDTGSNWDDTGSGGGDYGGDDGYDGYGLTKWKNRSPSASQVAKAEKSSSVYEGASWADKTITWSFANATGPFSGAIGDSQEQTAVEQAFQAWAKASGLNFNEVAAGTSADIEVGFSDLNTASTNQIGLTHISSTNGTLAGAQVELENPDQAPLTTNASGQLVYASTDTSLAQVALHEIGHALGLADNDDAGSIMNAVLSTANTTLDASDTANIQKLYGTTASPSTPSAYLTQSTAQLHQLIQAMSAFDGGDTGMSETGLPATDISLYQERTLLSMQTASHMG